MSGTSGRRRAVDCGIRWAPRRWAPTVRTTISRRAAGAGKRALIEYPRARLTLSLSIVVIGGGGGGGGGGTARGDAIRVRLLLSLVAKARARAITCGSFQARIFKLGEPSLTVLLAVVKLEVLQEESSSSRLHKRNSRNYSLWSFQPTLFHWWILIWRRASEFYSFPTRCFRAFHFSCGFCDVLISKLSLCSENSCFNWN